LISEGNCMRVPGKLDAREAKRVEFAKLSRETATRMPAGQFGGDTRHAKRQLPSCHVDFAL